LLPVLKVNPFLYSVVNPPTCSFTIQACFGVFNFKNKYFLELLHKLNKIGRQKVEEDENG